MFKEIIQGAEQMFTSLRERNKKHIAASIIAAVSIALFCLFGAFGSVYGLNTSGINGPTGVWLENANTAASKIYSFYTPSIAIRGIINASLGTLRESLGEDDLHQSPYTYNGGAVSITGWNTLISNSQNFHSYGTEVTGWSKDLSYSTTSNYTFTNEAQQHANASIDNIDSPGSPGKSFIISSPLNWSKTKSALIPGMLRWKNELTIDSGSLTDSIHSLYHIYYSGLTDTKAKKILSTSEFKKFKKYRRKTAYYAAINKSKFNEYAKEGVFYEKLNSLVGSGDDRATGYVNLKNADILINMNKLDKFLANNPSLVKKGNQVIAYIAQVYGTTTAYKQNVLNRYKKWIKLGYNYQATNNNSLKISGKRLLKTWSSYPKAKKFQKMCNTNKTDGTTKGNKKYSVYIQNEYNMHFLDLYLCYYTLVYAMDGGSGTYVETKALIFDQIQNYLQIIDSNDYAQTGGSKRDASTLNFSMVTLTRGIGVAEEGKIRTVYKNATNAISEAYNLGQSFIETEKTKTNQKAMSASMNKWFAGIQYNGLFYGTGFNFDNWKTAYNGENNKNPTQGLTYLSNAHQDWSSRYAMLKEAIEVYNNYINTTAKGKSHTIPYGYVNGHETAKRLLKEVYYLKSGKVAVEESGKNKWAFLSMTSSYLSKKLKKNYSGSTPGQIYVWGYPWRKMPPSLEGDLDVTVATKYTLHDKAANNYDVTATEATTLYEKNNTFDVTDEIAADSTYPDTDTAYLIVSNTKAKTKEEGKAAWKEVKSWIEANHFSGNKKKQYEGLELHVVWNLESENASNGTSYIQKEGGNPGATNDRQKFNRGFENVYKGETAFKKLHSMYTGQEVFNVFVARGDNNAMKGEPLMQGVDVKGLDNNETLKYEWTVEVKLKYKPSASSTTTKEKSFGESTCSMVWTKAIESEEKTEGEIHIGYNSATETSGGTISFSPSAAAVKTGKGFVANSSDLVVTANLPEGKTSATFKDPIVNLENKLTDNGLAWLTDTMSTLSKGEKRYIHTRLVRARIDPDENSTTKTPIGTEKVLKDSTLEVTPDTVTGYFADKYGTLYSPSWKGGEEYYYNKDTLPDTTVETGEKVTYAYYLYTWIDDTTGNVNFCYYFNKGYAFFPIEFVMVII